MKKLFIPILFLSYSIFAQALPEGFKISPLYNSFKPAKTNADNKVSQFLFRSAPVNSTTIISNFISDIIVIDNPAGDTIWFGTGKGVSRTIDRGLTFQNYYGTDPFGEDDVSGIAVYKNWVVVATATSREINEENIPTGTGIKVSSDYGVTWKKHPQPVDTQGDTIITYGSNQIHALPVVVEEQNLSYDILITRKNLTSDSIVIWIASWAGGIRKSFDLGEHFERVLLPPDLNLDTLDPAGTYNFRFDPRTNGNHKGFSLAALNDSTIFAGTSAGINKSTNWGLSWRKYRWGNTGSGTGISGNFVVALDVQRYGTNEILWGSTNPGEGEQGNPPGQEAAISYTTDAGLSWANTLDNDHYQIGFSHGVGFKDSIVYAATDFGVWRAFFRQGNFSWSKPSIIYDETIRDQIRTNFFYSVSGQGDSVWVGSGDGLARTVDTLSSPWVSKWKIFRAYQPIASTNDCYAAPNPFSPDDEVCRIYFKTGKVSSSVTIKIFDFAMFPVRTVIQNASRSTPDVIWVTWDGKRDDGMQVANGVYFYRIQIDKDETVWGKIIVLQ